MPALRAPVPRYCKGSLFIPFSCYIALAELSKAAEIPHRGSLLRFCKADSLALEAAYRCPAGAAATVANLCACLAALPLVVRPVASGIPHSQHHLPLDACRPPGSAMKSSSAAGGRRRRLYSEEMGMQEAAVVAALVAPAVRQQQEQG